MCDLLYFAQDIAAKLSEQPRIEYLAIISPYKQHVDIWSSSSTDTHEFRCTDKRLDQISNERTARFVVASTANVGGRKRMMWLMRDGVFVAARCI